jgi:hypothetical protein
VTHWFNSASNPCGLRNQYWKLSLYRLRNDQLNCFQGWRIDSTAQATPVASKISTENSIAAASEIIDETASTGDAWIRQCK